jgi:hypothetical protein
VADDAAHKEAQSNPDASGHDATREPSSDAVSQPSAATAERLGRAAVSALTELLGSCLTGSAGASSPISTSDGARDAGAEHQLDAPGSPAATNHEDEPESGTDVPIFALDVVVAAEALLDAVDGYPEWFEQHVRDGLLDQISGVLRINPDDDDPVLPQGAHKSTMRLLRYAVVVEALVALLEWTPREDDFGKVLRAGLQKLRPSARDRLETLAVALAALVVDEWDDRSHTFISFRVMRALRRAQERLGGQDQAGETTAVDIKTSAQQAVAENAKGAISPADRIEEATGAVWRVLKTDVEGKLARHQLGLMSSGEIVALAFGGAAAAVQGPVAARHANAAIRASLDVPDVATGWAEGRVVAVEADGAFRRSLAVPAPEVFSAVAEALLVSMASSGPWFGVANGGRGEQAAVGLDVAQIQAALGRGLQLLDNTLLDPPPGEGQPGWADELFGDQSASLWSTAAALRLAVASSDVASRLAREDVLARYETLRTSGRDWPKWLEWHKYWKDNEPDSKAGLLRYIHEEIVEPRRKAGPSSRTDPAIALLFGPPGTTKTTIARGVGNGLGWPVVNLSPANFLDEGLDAIERRAREVFADLRALSRAVVILDEADELFRKRRPVPETEAVRSVSAFMTASMLPRLQDLHDRGRIVLFICTNFLSSIDGAMRRVGRVDHLIGVPPPDEQQRRDMISRALVDELADGVKFLPIAIETLAHHTSMFIRGELLPAAEELAGKATDGGGFDNRDAAKVAAQEVADQRRKTITIPGPDAEDKRAWDEFLNDLEVLSAPHIQAGASSWPESSP